MKQQTTPIGLATDAIHKNIEYYIANNKTTPSYLLLGSPGIGKTMIPQQIAKDMEMDVSVVECTSLDPSDTRGLLYIDNGEARFTRSPLIPKSDKGILILDEFTSALPSVQTAFHSLMLDRRLGDTMIPKGWVVVLTGNRRTDTSIAYGLQPPAADRVAIIPVKEDLTTWIPWAFVNKIHPFVISYIEYRKDHFNTFDNKRIKVSDDAKSFVTPRSWTFCSDHLYSLGITEQTHSKNILNRNTEIYNGLQWYSSQEVSSSFISFMRIASKLPSVEDVLNNKVKVGDLSPEVKIALLNSAIYFFDDMLLDSIGSPSKRKKTMERLSKFCEQLPTEYTHRLLTHFIKLETKQNKRQYFTRNSLAEYPSFNKMLKGMVKVVTGK